MLAGQPRDDAWDTVERGASEAIRMGGEQASFTSKQRCHRRGQFLALAIGVSFGGGQKVGIPGNYFYHIIH
jgi:hypothetical protein